MELFPPAPMLQIDNQSRVYLNEAARWSRLLAIIGFTFCGLALLAGIYFLILIAGQASFAGQGWNAGVITSAVSILFFFVLFTGLHFFPCLYLFRFARNTRAALQVNDQATLVAGFANLKSMFRIVGVLTIMILAMYLVAICAWLATIAYSQPTHIGA